MRTRGVIPLLIACAALLARAAEILRMTLGGDPLTDNPFHDAGNGIGPRDYVYAYGFRNPFGGAWRAADGAHYEVENGPSVDRLARVDAGANYCWRVAVSAPPCEWSTFDDLMRQVTHSIGLTGRPGRPRLSASARSSPPRGPRAPRAPARPSRPRARADRR